jgi:hypothetical protein
MTLNQRTNSCAPHGAPLTYVTLSVRVFPLGGNTRVTRRVCYSPCPIIDTTPATEAATTQSCLLPGFFSAVGFVMTADRPTSWEAAKERLPYTAFVWLVRTKLCPGNARQRGDIGRATRSGFRSVSHRTPRFGALPNDSCDDTLLGAVRRGGYVAFAPASARFLFSATIRIWV